jgi:hypothetical protein
LIALCVAPELVLRLRKDEELTELLGLPLEAGHAQRKALDALFAGMDASGDGEIDEEEFVQYFARKAAEAAAAEAAKAAAAAAVEAEEALPINERIERIYEVHNPRKIDQVDALLAEWEGEEDVLYKNIKEKYGVPDDFFAPEAPGSESTAASERTRSEAEEDGSAAEDEESSEEEAESEEEQSAEDKAARKKNEEDEVAARYQWMVDMQREEEGDSDEEEEEGEDSEQEAEEVEYSGEEGGESADDEEEEEEDQTSGSEEEGEDEEEEAGSVSEEEDTAQSEYSAEQQEHDGDLGVEWDEENLHDIQRRSELIKQAKVFRVKITRDSTGRGTYTDIYAPEDQESKRGKDYKDPEVVRKQAHVDKIALVGEPKRRKSARHKKLTDPELTAIAAGIRKKIIGGGSGSGSDRSGSGSEGDGAAKERPWQKKLRERWDRPIDDDGVYTADSEMVQALKERKRLREEAEAAKKGSLLVSQYEYGGAGAGGDGDGDGSGAGDGDGVLSKPGADGEGEGDEYEYYSENGEEQEVFRVVKRGNRGRMKMSRVTAVKKKKRTAAAAMTPRAIRNQLMLDELSDVQRKDADEAATKAKEQANDAQSAEVLDDEHLPRAKASRNINVKHVDGSSSWIRKGQIIVITEKERGQPMRGYPEGEPERIGVFLKSRIIIRTEEQVSMFADPSESITEDEDEKEGDDDNGEAEAEAEAEEEGRATTAGTAASQASTKKSGLASKNSSQKSWPRTLESEPEPEPEPIGVCRFCGFSGPVSEHPTEEYPDCPHEPIVKTSTPAAATAAAASTSAPNTAASSAQRPGTGDSRGSRAGSEHTGADSEWSAEMWSALPAGDFFDLRKNPPPSNTDMMTQVTNPQDVAAGAGAGERPMTPETWAEGSSGKARAKQLGLQQQESWAKVMRAAGVKPQPRPTTADTAGAAEATPSESLQQSTANSRAMTPPTSSSQKEQDVKAVEGRIAQVGKDRDQLFLNALAGVEAVISRATTPQEPSEEEKEAEAARAARAEAEAERQRARVKAEEAEKEAAAATKIAAMQRGKKDRARVVELKAAKVKDDERTALFKRLREDAEAAAKLASDPKATAAAAAAAAAAEAESAAAEAESAKARAEAEAEEEAAVEKAELSDVFLTLDPPPSQIASSVADSFLGASGSRSLLPLKRNPATGLPTLPALTRPKKGIEAAKRLPRDPQLWSTTEVCVWLAGLGLDQYRSNFEEQSISGDALLELSASDLQGVGSLRIERLGHRKLLTKAISQLQHRSESDLSLAL